MLLMLAVRDSPQTHKYTQMSKYESEYGLSDAYIGSGRIFVCARGQQQQKSNNNSRTYETVHCAVIGKRHELCERQQYQHLRSQTVFVLRCKAYEKCAMLTP